MTQIYKPQPWRRHYGEQGQGRPLMLLGQDELAFCQPLLKRVLSSLFYHDHKELYSYHVVRNSEYRHKLFLSAKAKLKQLLKHDNSEDYHHEIDGLNEDLNIIFSDDGWKKIRLELSQIKKRNKKKRIELSGDLIDKLLLVKQKYNLSSYDEVIELLLERDEEEA
jgi:hypothetical protein